MPPAARKLPPPLPAVDMDEKVTAWVESAGCEFMVPSMAKLEGATEATAEVVRGLGQGAAAGVQLFKVANEKDAADVRRDLAAALFLLDKAAYYRAFPDATKAMGAAERTRWVMLGVCRRLTALGKAITDSDGKGADGERKAEKTLVLQKEEERGYTVTDYEVADMKQAIAAVNEIYNLRLRSHFLPTIGGMRVCTQRAERAVTGTSHSRGRCVGTG